MQRLGNNHISHNLRLNCALPIAHSILFSLIFILLFWLTNFEQVVSLCCCIFTLQKYRESNFYPLPKTVETMNSCLSGAVVGSYCSAAQTSPTCMNCVLIFYITWWFNIWGLLVLERGLPRWLSGKESTCQCRRWGFNPYIGRSPGVEMATHLSIFAWEISWTEEPGGLQSTGSQRVGDNWACTHNPERLSVPKLIPANQPMYSPYLPTASLIEPLSMSWSECLCTASKFKCEILIPNLLLGGVTLGK